MDMVVAMRGLAAGVRRFGLNLTFIQLDLYWKMQQRGCDGAWRVTRDSIAPVTTPARGNVPELGTHGN